MQIFSMRPRRLFNFKYLLKLTALSISLLLLFFYFYTPPRIPRSMPVGSSGYINRSSLRSDTISSSPVIYLWCTVVKVEDSNSPITRKFKIFIESLLIHANSNRSLSLNILTDRKSKSHANRVISAVANASENGFYEISFYDIDEASKKIDTVIQVMRPHFSSVPGTYYSDSLFYISLGLHKIAPEYHDRVILLDIDIKFEESVSSLFEKFSEFGEETLFGLAPELTPVYNHILWKWKQANSFSQFGEPSYRGYSGLNSGVMLMKLNAIRKSEEYSNCISRAFVEDITSKYFFKGHLGDQDFYTLLGFEKPHLIMILPCTWNRQLCQWWKYHGYADIFDDFARCPGQINIYHGNCNTPIPIK